MHGQEGGRLLQEKDHQGVFSIAADSAFIGEPVENFLDDQDRSTKSRQGKGLIMKMITPGELRWISGIKAPRPVVLIQMPPHSISCWADRI